MKFRLFVLVGVVGLMTPLSAAKDSAIGVMVGNGDKERFSAELSYPLADLAEGASFKLNVFEENGSIIERNTVNKRHVGISPTVVFGAGSDFRLTASHTHLEKDDLPDFGIPQLFNRPAAVDRRQFYGFESDYLNSVSDTSIVALEHDINEKVTLTNTLKYGQTDFKLRATAPEFVTAPTLSNSLNDLLVKRTVIFTQSKESFFSNELNVNARFDTDRISHKLVSGVDYREQRSTPLRYQFTGVSTTSLVNPNSADLFTGRSTSTQNTVADIKHISVHLTDTMALSKTLDFTAGARYDFIDTGYLSRGASYLDLDSRKDFLSYRGAFDYKMAETGRVFLSYARTFSTSAEWVAITEQTSNIDPEINSHYEVGTSWNLAKDRLFVKGSLFRTDRENVREVSANITLLSGTQRVEGITLEALGHFTPKWDLSFGYQLVRSEVLESEFFADTEGEKVANTPRQTLSLWSTHYLTDTAKLSAGAQFVDSRRLTSITPYDSVTGLAKEVPSYWTFSVVGSKEINHLWDLQVSIANLFNAKFYDVASGSRVIPGEGRVIMLSVRLKI